MKESIQPKYYQAKVTCNCGNEFVAGSTKPEIHVEVCSKCHPFYTGQQKTAAALIVRLSDDDRVTVLIFHHYPFQHRLSANTR